MVRGESGHLPSRLEGMLAALVRPVLALLVAGFLPVGGLAAPPEATYYVATTGDDDAAGTIDHPWRTIQKAASTLVAGDTVYIRAGTYREQVTPQISGSPGQYVTYAAYPGEAVTIDGSGIVVPLYEGLFYIGARDYVRVSGLRVVNSTEAGILADGSSHLVIEKNSTYNTASSGVGVWGGADVTVDGNRVEEACGGGMQECLTVSGTDTFEVRGNEVLSCHKEGLVAKDDSSHGRIYRNHVHHTRAVGIYVDAENKHLYDVAVFQNLVHDSTDNSGFALASEAGGLLENVRIYNNIAYGNRYLGLMVSDCCVGVSSHPMKDVTIINNTFANNGWAPWGGGITVDNRDIQNFVIRNNVLSQNLSFQLVVSPGVPLASLTVDHNLIDGYRGYEAEIYGADAVTGDARLVNSAGADFHLLGDSPAIDRGSAVGAPADDYDGGARPAGAGYDIGADEHGSDPTSLAPRISIDDRAVAEGNAVNASFRVTLSHATTQTVTVQYATADGTATAPSDYTATSGTLTFTPGRTSHSISVPIVTDAVVEGTETFSVSLSSPTNATLARGQATGTIDEPPTLATVPMYRAYNPNADYHFFTTSLAEKNNAVANGYRDESTPIPFNVPNTGVAGASAIVRMYNPNSGRHYYTGSAGERDSLKSVGWVYEKDEGFIYTAPETGTAEVFRLYNHNSGVHLYTANAGEKDAILAMFPGIWVQHSSLGFAVP